MKTFVVGRNVDYVVGHLRYGHRETEVEAESEEELKEKLKNEEYVNEIFEDSDLVVDDYEVDDCGEFYEEPWIIKEVEEDNYNYDYGILLLKQIKEKLGGPEPSDTSNAINKAIELFEERADVNQK